MPRISPVKDEQISPDTRQSFEKHVSDYNGRITNMKATLGHSVVAFDAYMQWYPLYEEVKKITGARLASIFAWSISEGADCPLCSTYFRKIIIESGEDPEQLRLTGSDQQLISFGAAIAEYKGFVPDEIYEPVSKKYSDKEMVILVSFAGIMIATNIFNNVLHTDIDEYLFPFTKK